MYELKPLTREGIPRALAKVERYRLLNEPWQAESICRDILAVDPENQEALVWLLLSLTDQFGEESARTVEEVREILPRLSEEYHQAYYAGIICERKGTAFLRKGVPGTGPMAYNWLTEAMAHYTRAEALRPPGNDDAVTRWNTCARLIMRHEHVQPPTPRVETFLE